MMPNVDVEVFQGVSSPNDWGDETFTEGAPTIVAGHIGMEKETNDSDGLIIRRCSIRVPLGTLVAIGTTVFRVQGHRWKPLSGKTSRNPRNFDTYTCQRLD